MSLAREVDVERFELPGRIEKQPCCVGAASLVERDLAAQVLDLGGAQRVGWAGLDRGQ